MRGTRRAAFAVQRAGDVSACESLLNDAMFLSILPVTRRWRRRAYFATSFADAMPRKKKKKSQKSES